MTSKPSPQEREYAARMAAERRGYLSLAPRVAWADIRPTAGIREQTLSFGADHDQHMLLVRPDAGGTSRPLIAFVHGGSWASGRPETYRFVGRFLARAGYPVAVIGYRHAPAHTFPAQLDDVVDAVRVAVRSLRAHDREVSEVVLAGQSAGAHLAALALLRPDASERLHDGLDITVPGGLFISGPLHLALVCPEPRWCPAVRALMGGDDGWERADPITYVEHARGTRLLALHGELDPVVSARATTSFASAACEARADVSLDIVAGAYHANLMDLFLGSRPETATVLDWLARLEASADR